MGDVGQLTHSTILSGAVNRRFLMECPHTRFHCMDPLSHHNVFKKRVAVIVLAAVMSTTDRLVLTIGTCFSSDIYKKILKPGAPDKQVLLVSQISVVSAGVFTLLLAPNPPDMPVWLIWARVSGLCLRRSPSRSLRGSTGVVQHGMVHVPRWHLA